jgi:hemerythrin-like domain-containing protein
MGMNDQESRRIFLFSTTMAGASLVMGACRKPDPPRPEPAAASGEPTHTTAGTEAKKAEDTEEVSATEDLMREHGVIRRVLVLYRESALRLRSKGNVPPAALRDAATLIRTFGEDYHERQLEEAHLFPALKKAGGPAAAEIDPLLAQHARGRELTEIVLAATQKPIGAASAEPLARSLEAFARMYESHAAREDTIVFPAWKKTMSKSQLDDMGELFESIEHKTFGKDGFDDAVDKLASIERAFGFEPAQLTPPPPKP